MRFTITDQNLYLNMEDFENGKQEVLLPVYRRQRIHA
jgi:hypothetical protein